MKKGKHIKTKASKKVNNKKIDRSLQRYLNGGALNKFKSFVRDINFKTNVAIANFKFGLKYTKEERLDEAFDLRSIVLKYASVQGISVALAFVIVFNTIAGGMLPQATTLRAEASEPIPYELEEVEHEAEQREESVVIPYDPEEDIVATIGPRELTNEEKILVINDKFDTTPEQFAEIAAYMMLEGGENHYDNVYDCTSALYHRTGLLSCINFVNNKMGISDGYHIYKQLICPGQFTVSKEKVRALMQTDMTVYSGYQAVIDMLYSEVPSLNFYRFVAPYLAHNYPRANYYLDSGNYFFEEVREWDMVDRANYLPNYGKYVGEDPSMVYQMDLLKSQMNEYDSALYSNNNDDWSLKLTR